MSDIVSIYLKFFLWKKKVLKVNDIHSEFERRLFEMSESKKLKNGISPVVSRISKI